MDKHVSKYRLTKKFAKLDKNKELYIWNEDFLGTLVYLERADSEWDAYKKAQTKKFFEDFLYELEITDTENILEEANNGHLRWEEFGFVEECEV